MALRFQLINSFLGSLVIDKADPIGINEMTQTVKRSTDNEGVIYEIIFDIDFIKEGRRFIKSAFENYGGIDAEVLVNVFEYDPNERKWLPYAEGRINFQKYELYEDKVTINIEQIGFQRRVLNLLDTDVDIETLASENGTALPSTQTNEIPYHSKTILKKTISGPQDSNEYQGLAAASFEVPADYPPLDSPGGPLYLAWKALGHPFEVTRELLVFGSLDTNGVKQDELSDFYKVSYSYIQADDPMAAGARSTSDYITHLMANKDDRFEIYRATEAGKFRAKFVVNMRHYIEGEGEDGGANVSDTEVCGGNGELGNAEILYWFELRDKNNEILMLENIVRAPTQLCGTNEFGYINGTFEVNNVDIQIGYKVYFYHTIRIWGNYTQPEGFSDQNIIHNFTIQPSPPVWDAATPFNNGDRVISGGNIWSSVINENIGHLPADDDYWDLEGAWSGSSVPNSALLETATTAPVTTANTILLYDAFLKCCQYVTNQVDCFKSDLLGRTELGYSIDGEGGLIGWTNGGNLRKLADKKIFASLKELIDFTDAVFCVGFGFEVVDGKNILRVERRSFFYNKTSEVVSLGKVYGIKARLNQKMFYKEIEYGYQGKLDIGKVNAVDEFNTLRRAEIPIRNTKNKLKISVKTRTSGYQIEAQRRLQFSTTDSKLDDENFAICLIRDATVGPGLRTKRDEGYVSIINVYDVPTGYNYDISPARCLKNWYQYLASMLVRSPNKIVKFAYGEVNYIMASKKTGEVDYLHEDGSFDLSLIEPLFEPIIYGFKDVKTTRAQFRLIKSNPYGYVKFEDQFGKIFNGFVSDSGIDHDSFKGKGDFELLKVFRS